MSGSLAWLALVASATLTGTVANPDIDELSGLALSRTEPGVLWGHNDTGGGAVLYRIGTDGADLGSVLVPGSQAGDWEDIAAFDDGSGPALLIADVGDNFGLRSYSTLYAVRDPGRGATAPLLWRLDFTFADGPRDCEAVAVDPQAREIVLVSKRDVPPRVYRLPLPRKPPPALHPPKPQAVAEFVGTLAPAPARSVVRRVAQPYAYAPTALAISADGLTAVIVTPRHAWLYRRKPGQEWIELFHAPGTEIPLPDYEQIEAAALSADGRMLYVGTEGTPGRWARIDLP